MKKEKDVVEKAFGIWSNMKEIGVVYVDRMRKESERNTFQQKNI